MAPQAELTRVVRLGDGTLALGRDLPGRGAWLCCGSVRCIDLAVKHRAFARALRGPIDTGTTERLRAHAERCANMDGRSTGRTENENPM